MIYLAWEDVPKVRQIAADEAGMHEEHGPNDGTCAIYQRAIGGEEAVQRHDSWCLYFVLWCFLQLLAEDMRQLRFLVPQVTGSCEDFRRAARSRGQLLLVGTVPLPGDIGLVVSRATGRAHHAFLVAATAAENGENATIEGNSTNTGGSNGNGTYTRDKRWGRADPAIRPDGANRYELVRLTDPAIPCPDWA